MVRSHGIKSERKYWRLSGLRANWQLYIMALLAIVLFFMFNYVPMFGAVIALKK